MLVFWWPGPGSFALLLTLTQALLSPTPSQTLRATTLYQPSCCFSHSLFVSLSFNRSFVCILPCSLWNTDALSNVKLVFASKDNSRAEKRVAIWSHTVAVCGLVMWRNPTSSLAPCFRCIFPYLKFSVLIVCQVLLYCVYWYLLHQHET